jgi:hypothetical protein
MVYHKPHSITLISFVKMKKLYPLAIAALFSTLAASAQTGGTYTALLPGNWHATGAQTPIWQGAEPPTNCNNCLISLNVAGTVDLNVHLVLTGASTLIIGGGGFATTLFIPNSGATDSLHSNSVNLINDGTNTTLQVQNNSSFVNVAGNTAHAGDFDGLFTTFVTGSGASTQVTSFKQVGFAPNGFVNDAIASSGAPAKSSLQGAVILSATGDLPILLSAFDAVLDGSQVNLTWTTDLEVNSDHFAVQRSTDAGSTWTTLGTVAAHGNSSLPINYSFADTKPTQGTNEYRLQLVDKDGTYKYSTVQSVRLGLVTSVSVYPNPARDYVNITLGGNSNESMNIRLFNQSGQVLQERNISNAGGTTVPLAVSSYPEGSYIIVVTGADGSRQISKLMIAK